MTIVNGNQIVDTDFVSTSAGAGDSGKVPKMDSSGELDLTFLKAVNQVSLTAGENVTKGDSLFLATSDLSYHLFNSNISTELIVTGNSANQYIANVYTVPNVSSKVFVKRFRTYLDFDDSSSGSTGTAEAQGYIYAVDGSNNPTGVALGTTAVVNYSGTFSLNGTLCTLVFASPIQLTAGTNYAFVVRIYSTDTDTDTIEVLGGGTPTSYVTSLTSSNGTTWSAGGGAMYFELEYYLGDVGKVYKTSASYYGTSRFLGFAEKTITSGNTVKVITGGNARGFSGLTASTYYYLSNTKGAIASSAGAFSKKIAYSVSTTEVVFNITGQNFNRYDIPATRPFPFDGYCEITKTQNGGQGTLTVYDETGATLRTFSYGVDQYASTPDLFNFWASPTLYPVKKGWSVSDDSKLIDEIKII